MRLYFSKKSYQDLDSMLSTNLTSIRPRIIEKVKDNKVVSRWYNK